VIEENSSETTIVDKITDASEDYVTDNESYSIDENITMSSEDSLLTEDSEIKDSDEASSDIQKDAQDSYDSAHDESENFTEADKNFSGVGASNATNNANEIKANVKNGWIRENGGYKYYKNGKAYTGWHKMGSAEGEKTDHWSYFGADGKIYTGWHYMSKSEGEKTAHWSFFGDNGWLRVGMQDIWRGTNNPDGNSAKHKSYFGGNGWLNINKTIVVEGIKYKADGRGWLTELNTQNETKAQKIDNEYNSLLNWVSEGGVDFYAVSNTEKARIIVLYIASNFTHSPDDSGSYSAVSMIDKRFGTCYGFSDLTRELVIKAGIRDAWLTVPGRMVDHGLKMYSSLHRTCVAYIDGAYYDLDSDSVYFNLYLILTDEVISRQYPLAEKISKSYADYLRGITDSYTSIQ